MRRFSRVVVASPEVLEIESVTRRRVLGAQPFGEFRSNPRTRYFSNSWCLCCFGGILRTTARTGPAAQGSMAGSS